MSKYDVKCGLYLHYTAELSAAVQNATNSGYNFIVTNLIHPRSDQFTPHSDLQLSSGDWNSLVVGVISNLDLENNVLENSNKIDCEITYAIHLGLPALLFECPPSPEGITQLSRIINSKITFNGGFQHLPQFWIQIPLHSPVESANQWRSDVKEVPSEDTWFRWNQFRSHITCDKRICCALELNGDVPEEALLNRWTGEPVKALIISTSVFLTNKKNYPVLSKTHQLFIRNLIHKMSNEIHFVIKGHCRHSDMRHYVQYLEHIKSTQLVKDPVSLFAKGYEDFLQIPLQPLMDNLESCTYEVFEKDPVKYDKYGIAIYEALKSICSDCKQIIIMVVGAGRGPLVEASLKAAQRMGTYVHIYAVEKNPNAIVTLRTLREQQWGGDKGIEYGMVEVISSDMREWCAPQKAHLVVSELLGSFGDNELSPECLDGVWSYVKEKAISIPSSYTSYLSPIQSQRLYCEASQLRDKEKPSYSAFETGYVVHMRNCNLIDEPKALFTFQHNNNLLLKPSQRDNSRFCSLEFISQTDTVCHGFAGYFEATLFGDIKISTVPTTHTPGMFSWFSIYFPIHNPVFVKKNQKLKVNYWRLINKRQIWYEWCLTEPIHSSIHNPNGRTYSIGLL